MLRSRTAPTRAGVVAAALASALVTSWLAPRDASAQGLVFRLPVIGQTSYTFTSTTLAAFRTTNFDANPFDDNIFALTERYDSAFAAPPWRLQVRLDGFVPLYTRPYVSPAPRVQDCPDSPMGCYLRPDGRFEIGYDPINGPQYGYIGIRPERIALRYQRGMLMFEGGDVYSVLGRGTALAFRKYDPLGIDNTIRGGRFEVDGGRVTVRGFGGLANPQNLDPVTLAVYQDNQGPRDFEPRPGYDALGGGETMVRLGDDEDIEVGVHGLRAYFPQTYARSSFVDIIGYRVTAPSFFDGALAIHLEVNGLRRTQNSFDVVRETEPGSLRERQSQGALSSSRDEFGRAIYGSALVTLGDWNALFDWKDYTNYILSPDGSSDDTRRVYSGAPSLERDDVQLRTNYNARGGRIRLNRALRPGPWSFTATTLVEGLAEETAVDPWSGDALGVVHAYVEVRRRGRPAPRPRGPAGSSAATSSASSNTQSAPVESGAGSAPVGSAATGGIGGTTRVAAGDWQFDASLGYRHEFLLGPQGRRRDGTFRRQGGEPDWQIAHAHVDVAVALDPNNSLEGRLDLRLENRFTEILPGTPGGPGFYFYSRSGFTLTWSHTDRLTVSAVVRYDTFQQAQGREGFPNFYPAGEVRYRFMAGSTIRIFGGITPGGRLCSGGLCRDVPPFQGALAELILRI